jgi:hypothetical protein
MNINQEIDAVVARLSAGEEPRAILTEFARAVRGAGRVTVEKDVFRCIGCKTVDLLCFKCKSVSLVGEQGVAALPMLLAKLGPMVMGWSAERKAKKEAEERSEAEASHHATQQAMRDQASSPPPSHGPQRF